MMSVGITKGSHKGTKGRHLLIYVCNILKLTMDGWLLAWIIRQDGLLFHVTLHTACIPFFPATPWHTRELPFYVAKIHNNKLTYTMLNIDRC